MYNGGDYDKAFEGQPVGENTISKFFFGMVLFTPICGFIIYGVLTAIFAKIKDKLQKK